MEGLAGSWFLYAVLALLLWIWIDYKKKSFWIGKGINYLTPIPFIGSIKTFRFATDNIHNIEREYHLKHGPIFGHFEGPNPILSVGDPDIIRTITVKDFNVFTNRGAFAGNDAVGQKMLFSARDEDWKRIRSAVTPSFTSGKMRKMAYLINECVGSLIENIKEHADVNKPVETKKLLGAFTMDVISSTAFATRIDSHKDPDNPIVANARQLFTRDLRFIFPFIQSFPNAINFLLRVTKKPLFFDMGFFKEVTQKVLADRRANPKEDKRSDFLQLMIEAQYNSEADGGNTNGQENQIIHKLTEEEIFAQCVAFFIVGFDTTATTITMALFLLAWHQEVQKKVHEEIDEALKKSNGEVNYDVLKSMPLVEAIICETLRMYPTISRIEREAAVEYTIPDVDITIPKKTRIHIPVYGLHMDPKYFPDPEKFDPNRFMPDNKESINPYVYMPFGSGPRNCVAMRFAQMESRLCLVHVLKHFSMTPCTGTKRTPEFLPGQFLLQPKDVFLDFKCRAK